VGGKKKRYFQGAEKGRPLVLRDRKKEKSNARGGKRALGGEGMSTDFSEGAKSFCWSREPKKKWHNGRASNLSGNLDGKCGVQRNGL